MDGYLETVFRALESSNDRQVIGTARAAIKSGVSAIGIFEKGLVPGMQALRRLCKDAQVYLPETDLNAGDESGS